MKKVNHECRFCPFKSTNVKLFTEHVKVHGFSQTKTKYKVSFLYDGKGEVAIEAASASEARELFMQGEWEVKDAKDDSDNYSVENVVEL